MDVDIFADVRPGIKDIWNARIVRDAQWTKYDLPINPNVATMPPRSVVSWKSARRIHRNRLSIGDTNYRIAAHVHFFLDDEKFDGSRCGIWADPEGFLEIISHFDGVAGIDFSTHPDFPCPILDYQFYRIRAMEYYASVNGVDTIQNARWGDPSTWDYCFDTLHAHAPLVVGTVGSGLRLIENRPLFEAGIRELVCAFDPKPLVVVGSAQQEIFHKIRRAGTEILQFDGDTAAHFAKRGE